MTDQLCETENYGIRIGLSVGLGLGVFIVFLLSLLILIKRHLNTRKIHNSDKSDNNGADNSKKGD